MENKNWKELWLKNYRGEGDTSELIDFVKKLNYGSRNNVSYLPWAVVERIFKFQDGQVEILPNKSFEDANRTSIVEADRVLVKDETDANGVLSRTYANSYFINIRATWLGQVHIERYPIQDSNGRPLSFWTQNDLNKAVQRGKVKAIAIVSGIGFKLFEDGDLQFDLNPYEGAEPYEPTSKTPATPPKPVVEAKPKQKAETKVEPKQEPVKEIKIVAEKTTPENREEMENKIKKQFLAGGEEITIKIRAFLLKAQVKKVSDLSQELLEQLFAEVN
jgi:hypothetical protein